MAIYCDTWGFNLRAFTRIEMKNRDGLGERQASEDGAREKRRGREIEKEAKLEVTRWEQRRSTND